MSMDPLAHETLEPYVFTGNNPVMLVDPDGREIVILEEGTEAYRRLEQALMMFEYNFPEEYTRLENLDEKITLSFESVIYDINERELNGESDINTNTRASMTVKPIRMRTSTEQTDEVFDMYISVGPMKSKDRRYCSKEDAKSKVNATFRSASIEIKAGLNSDV